MKLVCWNVNGIRAVWKKGFRDFLDAEKPDILCVQETKIQPEQLTGEPNSVATPTGASRVKVAVPLYPFRSAAFQ